MLSFQLSSLVHAELIEPIRLYSGDLMRTSLVPRASPSPEMAVTSPEMAVALRFPLPRIHSKHPSSSYLKLRQRWPWHSKGTGLPR